VRLMGYARPRPKKLAHKLRQIRMTLGLSQTEIYRQLGVEDQIPYTRISKYELDENEPPLLILLQYARVAGLHMETIVDDNVDLPAKLPGLVKYDSPQLRIRSKRNKTVG
jgi:transcriptional regulator with XRE-family HTH domain